MGTPKGNGLVEIRGEKTVERGFNCMKLIEFLTEDGVKDWDNWHGAHEQNPHLDILGRPLIYRLSLPY